MGFLMFPVKVTQRDVEFINENTLWLLENVGIDFEEAEAAALFKARGARGDGARVYIPESLLKEALASTPGAFTVRGLSSSVTIGGGEPVYVGSSNAVFILKEGRLASPTSHDFIDILKLCETSPVLNMVNSQHIYASDLPAGAAPAITTALALQYCGKPVITLCGNYEQSVDSLRVARDFFEGAQGYYALGVGNMVSPLRYTGESIVAIRAYAEFGQPMVLACCASFGMTSPITVGGTVVQNNAEVLAGIVYARLLHPGLPMVYGNVSGGLDMRHMTSTYGAFEAMAVIPYAKAMADFYGLPARSGGALTDSKQVDYQAGTESALSIAATVGAGIDFAMHMAGEFDSYNAYSLEKHVMDEESIERCRFLQGLDLFGDGDDDVDAIRNVGPGGQFLMEEQTLDLYRDAQFMPEIAFKEPYASWEAGGGDSVFHRAAGKAARRLAEYSLPVISQSQQRMLGNICKNG